MMNNTLRHYYISDNLDELEVLEEQLEAAGVSTPQIHVLSTNDADVASHRNLHDVTSFMKKDVVHSTKIGAVIGAGAVALILSVAYFSGWTESPAGWIPFIFLAVVVFGFCTWEGGLFGIQVPNHNFSRFQKALKEGKHVLFVDLEPDQETVLQSILNLHPQVEAAGTESNHQLGVIEFQKRVPRFFKEAWP